MDSTDVKELLYFAALTAAQAAGIESDNLISTSELTEKLRRASPDLAESLDHFMTSYLKWFGYSEQSISDKITDASYTEGIAEVMSLMQKRDEARNRFITALKEARSNAA